MVIQMLLPKNENDIKITDKKLLQSTSVSRNNTSMLETAPQFYTTQPAIILVVALVVVLLGSALRSLT